MIRKLLIVILFCSTFYKVNSQEENSTLGVLPTDIPTHNLVKYNRFYFNPTFSLVRETKRSLNVYNKIQWASFNDNPQTYLINYTTNFDEKTGVSIGLHQQNEGIYRYFGGVANFAYALELNRDMNFTFGLNLGFSQSGIKSNIDSATAVVLNNGVQVSDPVILNYENSSVFLLTPGINFNYLDFDIGVSVGNLVAYNLSASELATDNIAYSGHIMYTRNLESRRRSRGSDSDKLIRGMAYANMLPDADLRYGANIILEYPSLGWAQAGYNSFYGASVGIGANINKSISVGYTYETGFGDTSNFGATHEVGLAYNFFKEQKRGRRKPNEAYEARDSEIRRLKKEILDQNKLIRELQNSRGDSLGQAQRAMNKLERSIQEAKEEEEKRARELSLQREEEVKLLNRKKEEEELAARKKLELEMAEKREQELAARKKLELEMAEQKKEEEAAAAVAQRNAEEQQAEEARIAAEETEREAEAARQEAAEEAEREAEATRQAAAEETERQAEAARQAAAETERQKEEAARLAEEEVKKQEEQRIEAEEIRKQEEVAEKARVEAEAKAAADEAARIASEKKLQLEMAAQKAEEERIASQKKLEREVAERKAEEERIASNKTLEREVQQQKDEAAEAERLREEAEAARLAEEERIRQETETARLAAEEQVRQQAEAARLAEEERARQEAEAARLAAEEQARQQAEAARLAEEERARQEAEAVRLAEEERARQEAEAARLAAEERARQEAEAVRLAEEERARQEAEAARLAEEERARQEAEAARLAEEERARQEAEAARLAEEERARQEAEAARLAEEERARQEAEAARLAAEEQARQEAEAARLAEEERARQEAEAARLAAEEQARQEAATDTKEENLEEIQKELDNSSRITSKLIAARDSLLTTTTNLDKREFSKLLESLVNMEDEAEEVKKESDPASSKRLTSRNRFIKFAEASRPEAKFATKYIPGYPEGYYLIGNVFRGGTYADKFTSTLNDLGFNDAQIILNPENQYQYVSIKSYRNKDEAAENYLNNIGNKYFGDMWILHIAKSRVESLKKLVQETRIIKDTVKDDTVLTENLSYIGGHNVENGYYLITNIYKRENYFERGMSKLKSQGLDPKYFRNPKDNYIYVYLEKFDNLDEAKQNLFSNMNNTYNGDLYILKIQ